MPEPTTNLTVTRVLDDLDTGGVVQRAPDFERIRQAKLKRQQQLKQWAIYEHKMEKESAANPSRKHKLGLGSGGVHVSTAGGTTTGTGKRKRNVVFPQNIILLEAAARDDVDEVRRLLQSGISPDVSNEDGLTALHQCCIDKSVEMCKLLLQFKANVNARDSELWTPLHAAATCGHWELCKILSDHNANFLAVNADGNMPYDICDDEITLDFIEHEMAKQAITQQQIDETRLAPEREMVSDMTQAARRREDLNKKDAQGATPLHIAASCGYVEVAEFLVKQNIPLHTEDKDGWQATHIAACWGHPDIIEILVRYGADIDAKTRNGETVFDICEDGEMKERLLQIKADQENLKKLPRNPSLSRKRSINNNPRSIGSLTSIYDSYGALHKDRKNSLSASIRRSSMRQKSQMSRKDAKLEAEMRNICPPGDVTETDLAASSAAPISPHQVSVAVHPSHPLSAPSGLPSPLHMTTNPSPMTNVDPSLQYNNNNTLPSHSYTLPPPQQIKRPSAAVTGSLPSSSPLTKTSSIRQPPPIRASPPMNGYMIPATGEQPLRRFKAPENDVIGGDNTKSSSCKCCTIM